MKLIPGLLLAVVLLLFVTLRHSFALSATSLTPVSKKWAEKELGMKISMDRSDTNKVTVSFDFAPTNKFSGFNYVSLIIYSELYQTSSSRGELGRLLASSKLDPLIRTPGRVFVSFQIDPAYLNRTEIDVVFFSDQNNLERAKLNADNHGYVVWLWRPD